MEKNIDTLLRVQDKIYTDLDKALEDYFLDTLFYNFCIKASEIESEVEIEFGIAPHSLFASKLLYSLVDSTYGCDYIIIDTSKTYFEINIFDKNYIYNLIVPRVNADNKLALDSIREVCRRMAEEIILKKENSFSR